jgi:membrane AbrB-like protein
MTENRCVPPLRLPDSGRACETSPEASPPLRRASPTPAVTATLETLKTFAIAAVGGGLFTLAGVPLSWMLGALAFTMVASQLVAGVRVPKFFREGLQPVLGVALGSYFTPTLFGQLAAWPAVLAFVAAYVVVAGLFGYAYFRRAAKRDRLTAFFSALPGGLSDLTLVGASMGADIVFLGLVHAVRVLTVVISLPFIISLTSGPLTRPEPHAPLPLHPKDLAILVACGVIGYFLGRWMRIPAGGFLGPLSVSAAVHLLGLTASSPPGPLISAVQVVLGAYIGARFVDLEWRHFRTALGHGFVWSIGLVSIAAASAALCAWATGFGLPQLLLAFAPGGVAEMGLLTLALGIDVALVTTCHIGRILMVYTMVPLLARYAQRGVPPVKDTGFTDD